MTNEQITPKLIVLGAGPGDPELITMKGYKALQNAGAILYDNLANKELLDLAKDDCEKIYVGKRPYDAFTAQEEIHELIKHYAFTRGLVVRLKGGDPFIFGRGFEEVLYARGLGIQTEFIPGITSMQTAGFYDIPLTHRAISEGIWVVTGTKKDGSLSADLRLAMQSNATVVVYMGMKQLPTIAQTYIDEGRGETPAAIIQHGSLPQHKWAKGAIKNMPLLAEQHQLTYPSIIIIGQVTDINQTL